MTFILAIMYPQSAVFPDPAWGFVIHWDISHPKRDVFNPTTAIPPSTLWIQKSVNSSGEILTTLNPFFFSSTFRKKKQK